MRIESPVPDSTETPARTLKAIVLPAPDDGPADRVVRGVVADDDAVDFVAQRCLAGDVGADQVALDQVGRGRGAVEPDAPVVARDQVLGRRRRAADGVAGRPENRDALLALGIACSPVLSVPIRLPATRFRVDVAPEMTTPCWLPEITCEPLASPSIRASVAFSIRMPSMALPRSISPVMSVPIRLP